MIITPHITAFESVSFIIVAIVLYIALRIILKLFVMLKLPANFLQFIKKLIPVLDFVFAIILVYWLVIAFFSGTQMLPVILSVVTITLIALIAWFWFRDFVAGIFLKSENEFSLNTKVKIDNRSGTIVKTTLRHIELETSDGERIKIPYSKLSGSSFSQLSYPEKYESHLISFTIVNKSDFEKLREELKRKIYFSPWHLPAKEPEINFVTDEKGEMRIDIKIATLKPEHADLIRKELLKAQTSEV